MPRMEANGTQLGPLEPVGGHWAVGDATRPDAHWVEFRPDGLHQREPDSEGRLVPWSRIMSGIRLTWGKHSWNTNDRAMYTPTGMVAGRDGGWMHMTLRHPYEDHQLRFDQHARPYRAVDALRLESLLRQLSDEGKLHLLGDPEWVGRAVACLAGGTNSRLTQRALRRVAAEAMATAGPGSP
ncbi:hypothetical protein GCM10018980_59850 [Streptomyces capoamus]|uniref:Uncharacterized protein n=2 Tax=Streptomyces capoamus TaxID=68183 RepID=A0A919KEX9_9ACTN|nr:hypothetical protein [Streptomyces capoamus]GGW20956.1 hypothetical protein GCM10010501_71120 [Streptomyces libani subsp. rufus]GHG67018.1 hypothetical protein GCM10018980_59850 [Streptomyces capoamus]